MTAEFIEKVVKLQSEVKVLKSLKNNFGNYTYRNVEQILAEVKPILQKLGLMLFMSDEIVFIGENRFYIKAKITLTDGANKIESFGFAREADAKKGMDEAQLTGSCSSYARKYALGGLLLLDDNKDIDSMDNASQTNTKTIKVQTPKIDIDLKKLKESVFAELQAGGVERDEMISFFKFAGIDKDSKKDLKDFLSCDIMSLISQFKESKEMGVWNVLQG